ncbi:MAG: hypothetical protein AAB706_01255 [Patescibacteria group bacterium]
MATNVKVEKSKNENSLGLLRRFTKRVQGAGILRKVRKGRYFVREKSPDVRKKKTLQSLIYKKNIEKLIKLGKITPKTYR